MFPPNTKIDHIIPGSLEWSFNFHLIKCRGARGWGVRLLRRRLEKLLVFAEVLVTVGTRSVVATNDIVVEKDQRLAKNELFLLFYFF